MRLTPSSVLRVGAVLLIVAVIPACKTTSRLRLDTTAVKQPVPRRAAFYISPEFHQRAREPLRTDVIPVLVDETIMNGVRTVVEAAFRESVEVSSIEEDLPNGDFDALVVPEITLLDLRSGFGSLMGGGIGGRSCAIFQVRWAISDPRGQLLWLRTITTTRHARCYTRWCPARLMEKTIKDQFQQALEEMTDYDWWTVRH